MLPLPGFSVPLPPGMEFFAEPIPAFILNIIAWILILLITNFILMRVIKFIARRLPGDLEDSIVGIISRPLVILLGLYGLTSSLALLPLLPAARALIDKVSLTVVILIATHIVGKFIEDVIVYNGEKWAARTETRVDDVIIPILHLFGPPLLVLIAALLALPLWGINITSILIGAGVLGLVLGLALQETLSNIFSGLSLLIESPFRKGDLVLLPDGRTSEVLHLGMRSTKLFSLNEQATIYIPNQAMATGALVNLTQPTPEQRYCIDVRVDGKNLAQAQSMLLQIANGHPAVLSSAIPAKIQQVRAMTAHIRQSADQLPVDDPAREALLDEADKNEHAIEKLTLEGYLNEQIIKMMEILRDLLRGINLREGQGLNNAERQEIYCNFVSPADNAVASTLANAQAWANAQDPWLDDTDYWNQRKVWDKRNEQLRLHWERLKKTIYQEDDRHETRLDDGVKAMLDWLVREYKVPPGSWKNPAVAIKALEGTTTQLQLCFYVDHIRLEHDTRAQRVRTELGRQIQEKLNPPPVIS